MEPAGTRIRVRYAETDQMGIAYHANFIVWMEVGRVELCRSRGISYRDMESDGILMTVAEASCRYSQPARFDEEVVVEAVVSKAHPRMVVFEYTLRRAADGQTLATGQTRHVFCTRELKPCKLPEKYFDLFGIHRKSLAGN